jgi:hypothetical protein
MPASARPGDVVTCAPGTWSGEDLTLTYEFHRLGSPTTLLQSGESDTYAVTPQDTAGIVCVVLAANEGGTAWRQSLPTAVSVPVTPVPVTPVGVPPSQVPAAATPRVPVGPAVADRVAGAARDAASPQASRARASCAARRCTVSVRVTDAAPSSGIRRVTGTLRWTERCTRGGRRTTCTRTRRITGRRSDASTWTLRTPRLPRGAASMTIVAVDNAGRVGARPARVTFRVR